METSFSFWFLPVPMANLHHSHRGTVQSSSVTAFQSQSCYEFVCQSINPYSGAANSSDIKPWAKHKGHTHRQQHADPKQVTLWPTFSSALISSENLYSQAHKANLLTERENSTSLFSLWWENQSNSEDAIQSLRHTFLKGSINLGNI